MIIFADDKLSSIYTTDESVGYLKENLQDSDQKNPWRAGTDDSTLEITVASGALYVALFGIEGALTVDVTCRDSMFNVLSTETGISVAAPLNRIAYAITNPLTTRCDIRLYGGTDVGASILRVAAGTSLPDPEYGFSRAYVDYGVRHAYKTGGYYTLSRGRARKFSGSMVIEHADDTAINEIVETFDAEPLAILATESELQRDAVFGSFVVDSIPTVNFAYPDYSKISMTIMEYI